MGLEQLIDFPFGEHAFQDAAVVRVGKSNQLAGQPSVELCFAGPATPQSRISFRGDPVVLTAKSAVGLQVTVLEQHLQHDRRLGVQRC